MEEGPNASALIIVILLVISLVAIWWNVVRDKQPSEWETLVVTNPIAREVQLKLLDLIGLIAAEHARTLYIKSRQLVTEDAYGNRDATRFYREIDYFIDEVITRDERFLDLVRSNQNIGGLLISSLCGAGQATLRHEAGERVIGIVSAYRFVTDKIEPDLEAADPLEFEVLCAQKMENAGWDAQLTKGSGDQGADVICRKDGISIVLQCKLYSSPIGNKAVQEAFAARTYYALEHAAVVSNQPYTKSAKELANMTGVLLLHFHELDSVDALIAALGEA